jgi:hypothetical protein
MNTINKLLARLGYKLTRTDGIGDFSLLQQRHQELMVKMYEAEDRLTEKCEQIKELKRKLACKTAGEWYWRKQAREARGQ